jgi:uroporphyrinogen-III synthase
MSTSLHHKTIVLTRSVAGNRAWKSYLQARGARVYTLPTIETVPLPLTTGARAMLLQLPTFDWLLLTSAVSVRLLRHIVGEARLPWPIKDLPVAAIGLRTATAAERAGLRVIFRPSHATSASLGQELPAVEGRHILLPQSTISPDELAGALRKRGGLVTVLHLYETRLVAAPDETLGRLLDNREVDYCTFASPSAVRGFKQRLPASSLVQACAMPAVAIGPTVAKALEAAGFTNVHTSTAASIAGITKILEGLANS